MTDAPGPSRRIRMDARASGGGRVLQAGRDLHVSEFHQHTGAPGPVAVVEPVLPADDALREVFVGRSAESQAVLAIIDPAHDASATVVVSAVAGLGGIGKTALARSCAAEAVSRGWYPGGAVFVDLDGYAPDPADHVQPEHAFGPMLHALGWHGPVDGHPRGQAAQYHRLLAERAAEGRPVLVVLDNAGATTQVADLLPRSRAHRAVVTSRHTLAVRGSRTLELATLTEPDAQALIVEQLALLRPGDTRTRDDVRGTVRLSRLCGRLPLALHIATALLAADPAQTPGSLADDLEGAHSRLDILDDGERAVRATFELSYRRLTADQATLFRLLPVNPGPHVAADTAGRLIGLPAPETRRLLHQLGRAHVLERAGEGLWRQHDLMRVFAIELLGRHGDDQNAAANRLLDHYIIRAAAAVRTLRGTGGPSAVFDDADSALAWFEREQPNIQAAVSMAVTFGDSDGALRLQEAMVALHAHHGRLTEWESAARTALRFAEDERDPDGRSWAMSNLAHALSAAGRHDEAATAALELMLFHREVVREAKRDADGTRPAETEDPSQHHGPARTTTRGLLRDALRAVVEARPLLDRDAPAHAAYDLLIEIADAATGLDPLGSLSTQALREAVASSHRAGRRRSEALACARLALTEPLDGTGTGTGTGTASRWQLRALRVMPPRPAPEDRDAWREVCALIAAFPQRLALADRASPVGDRLHAHDGPDTPFTDSVRAFTSAVEAYGRIDDTAAQASLWGELGGLALQHGAHDHAWAGHHHALNIRTALGDLPGRGRSLAGLGEVALARGDFAKAVDLCHEASALLEAGGVTLDAGRALTSAAYAHQNLGQLDRAADAARRAAELALAAHDTAGRVSALLAFGLALRDSGRTKRASRSWRQALRLAKAAKDPSVYHSTRRFLDAVGFHGA
ncbi:ATP-binding protein [Streptomyces sp. NPDC056470]|uniref:ATP-binding protein n=1 Tax=Streptomyces sp. NPDC056470 TaxID=3345831 RepID=UPI00367F92F5